MMVTMIKRNIGRLGDETVHIDFEERFYKAFGLMKEQCYYSMQSENKYSI